MARDPVTRGLRDEADVGPDPRTARELKRLSELRYKVADGDPDIRGWRVYASTGRELGTVSDLLVDVEAGEVVMLDVDLRRNDRHTLAPIRAAWIDHATQRVVLDAREAERAVALALHRSGTRRGPRRSRPEPFLRRTEWPKSESNPSVAASPGCGSCSPSPRWRSWRGTWSTRAR